MQFEPMERYRTSDKGWRMHWTFFSPMKRAWQVLFLCCVSLGVLGIVGLSGCKPKYPNCEGDTDCPGNAQGKEWCVNGQCQQCRPDGKDCGPGNACVGGRCQAIPGYCGKPGDCPSGVCQNNRCVACKDDSGCPAGGRCSAGKCEADSRKICKSPDDCAETEDCVNGRCTPVGRNKYAAQAGDCRLDTVYFGYNEFELSGSNTSTVDHDAECLKKNSGRSVTLVGHTDPRGTPEYNLALSDKRAQAVKRRLNDLGISPANMFMVPRGEMDATGNDEASWSQDRRVEVNWR